MFIIFFSSRRRHTRCALVTWSSDVCSSDLIFEGFGVAGGAFDDRTLLLGIVEGGVDQVDAGADARDRQQQGKDDHHRLAAHVERLEPADHGNIACSMPSTWTRSARRNAGV